MQVARAELSAAGDRKRLTKVECSVGLCTGGGGFHVTLEFAYLLAMPRLFLK